MRLRVSNTRLRLRTWFAKPVVTSLDRAGQLGALVRLADQAQDAGQREVATSLISLAYLLHDGSLTQTIH